MLHHLNFTLRSLSYGFRNDSIYFILPQKGVARVSRVTYVVSLKSYFPRAVILSYPCKGPSTQRHQCVVFTYLCLWNALPLVKHLITSTISSYYSLSMIKKHTQGLMMVVARTHFWATFIDIWRFFSGHTGCFRHQRSAVQIQSSALLLTIII